MAELRGALFRIYKAVGGYLVPIGKSTSGSISITMGEIEIAHKDLTGNAKKYEANKLEASGTVEGIVALDETNVSYFDILSNLQQGDIIGMAFTTATAGDKFLSFNAVITEQSANAPDGDLVTFNISFRNSGPIEVLTYQAGGQTLVDDLGNTLVDDLGNTLVNQ